jgi:AraC family transcriptional activator of tynA and feaB
MSQLFSTELFPASDRIDAWQWNAQQICGDCRIQLPHSSFRGSIGIQQIGALRLTRFSSSPLSFSKWPKDTFSEENRPCLVITQLAGARRYAQNGAEVLLNGGDTTIIDASHPWSSSCEIDCVRLYLRVPRWMLENRLRRRDIPVAQKIWGTTKTGAALHRLSQSLYYEARTMDNDETEASLDAYFHALAVSLGCDEISEETGAGLLQHILRYIDSHLAEPTLSPVEVASATGISLRHLHRVFSATDSTMGDYVRGRRLEQCRKDMLDSRLRAKTITEIAFSWGFSDAAHFSHAFRKQFGTSPRAFRSDPRRREEDFSGFLDKSASQIVAQPN